MKNIAKYLNTFINAIIFFIVYIIGIGITYVIFKLFKKEFIKPACLPKEKNSYWHNREFKKIDGEGYYQQF